MESESNDIIIIGAGGHARVVIEIARLLNYSILGIVDTNYSGKPEEILGVKVIGNLTLLNEFPKSINIAIAIGDNQDRERITLMVKEKGYYLPTLIHPSAIVSKTAIISSAALLCAGTIISANANIGFGSIINTGSIVDHESILRDFVHLAPGVSVAGRVRIDRSTFVGIGATIIDSIVIGENVVIGAGSTVIKDIPSNSKVVGVSKSI